MISGGVRVELEPSMPVAAALRTHSRACSGLSMLCLPLIEGQAVGEHPGRGDLVPRAPRLLAFREGRGRKGNAAAGRDAVRHPELVGVLRVGRLGGIAGMQVQVHEPGKHVHSRGVDLLRGVLRPVGGRMSPAAASTANSATMRFRSTTMSTGPRGGAPVPSITVALRMISRSKGPSPSARGGAGRGSVPASWATARRAARRPRDRCSSRPRKASVERLPSPAFSPCWHTAPDGTMSRTLCEIRAACARSTAARRSC